MQQIGVICRCCFFRYQLKYCGSDIDRLIGWSFILGSLSDWWLWLLRRKEDLGNRLSSEGLSSYLKPIAANTIKSRQTTDSGQRTADSFSIYKKHLREELCPAHAIRWYAVRSVQSSSLRLAGYAPPLSLLWRFSPAVEYNLHSNSYRVEYILLKSSFRRWYFQNCSILS